LTDRELICWRVVLLQVVELTVQFVDKSTCGRSCRRLVSSWTTHLVDRGWSNYRVGAHRGTSDHIGVT